MVYPPELYEMRFEWPNREPSAVVVTGSFDQWSRSVSLSKTETGFVGTVRVPWAEKIKYKFVVDGKWTCQAGQPTETDPGGFVNNVYITPPKPIAAPQSLDEVINASVVEDIPMPAEQPAPVVESTKATETKFAAPIALTPQTAVRLPIPIIPVNDPEHNTILTTPPPAPIPDYVLPPSPRARSTSPPPNESRRPVPVPSLPEPEPVRLHEVEPTLQSAGAVAPEVPAEEKKQEAEAAIPVDCTAPEHLAAKVEELVVTPEEERIVVPEAIPIPETPAAKPEEKSVPSALPTPPATPNPKAQRGSQSPSPTASPSSSRFGTTKSRKKRHSIFGKIKEIFSSDKDKEKIKSPK